MRPTATDLRYAPRVCPPGCKGRGSHWHAWISEKPPCPLGCPCCSPWNSEAVVVLAHAEAREAAA